MARDTASLPVQAGLTARPAEIDGGDPAAVAALVEGSEAVIASFNPGGWMFDTDELDQICAIARRSFSPADELDRDPGLPERWVAKTKQKALHYPHLINDKTLSLSSNQPTNEKQALSLVGMAIYFFEIWLSH